MTTYKDEGRASTLLSIRGRLRGVKEQMARDGVFEHLGLTDELADAVQGYSSGAAQTAFSAALVTRREERQTVAKAITSAIQNINTTLDSLEL